MKPVESYGKVTDLFENVNGNQGQLIYLKDSQEESLVKKYNDIKGAKQIIAAYGLNGRHYLVIAVGGIVKKVIKKSKNK